MARWRRRRSVRRPVRLASNGKSSCECISNDGLDLFREVFAQHPFEKAAIVGRQVREGCPRLRPECDRGDAVAPDQLPLRIDPMRIARMKPVVKPVDCSRQVGIRVQLRHQHGDGRFDIAARVMCLSSDLSVSNSLSGRLWELDQVPAVGDPTDIVQLGTGHHVAANEGRRRVALQRRVAAYLVVGGQTPGATQRCLNPGFSDRIGHSRRTGSRCRARAIRRVLSRARWERRLESLLHERSTIGVDRRASLRTTSKHTGPLASAAALSS